MSLLAETFNGGDLRDAVNDRSTFANLRQAGYRPIATNPGFLAGGGNPSATLVQRSYRTRHVAGEECDEIVLVFANYAAIGGAGIMDQGYNALGVQASVEKIGTTDTGFDGFLDQCSFGGRRRGNVDAGALLFSTSSFMALAKGENFYVRTAVDNLAVPGPVAPTVTPSAAGGALVAGATYNVSLAYVFADGSESLLSARTSTSIPSGGSNVGSISVTSPEAYAGAIGYRAFISARNASGNFLNLARPCQEGMAPIGANIVIGREQTSVGRQRLVNGQGAIVGGGGVRGSGVFDGLGNGEAYELGDKTLPGSNINVNTSSPNIYAPVVILGRTKGPIVSVALLGDSKQAGTGDGGAGYGLGGFGARALSNKLDLPMVASATPRCGYMQLALGGDQIAYFAAALQTASSYDRSRHRLAEFANNIISNYGNNDKGGGLAAYKANLLRATQWFCSRGIKWHQMTLPPSVNTTTGFSDVAGQSVQGTEATRLSINAWLRDVGPTGWRQQSGYFDLTGVIETCERIEVNSSGVLTLDGGFVIVPPGRPSITGTLTSVNSKTEFRDNTKSWTRNQYKGYSIRFTTGAAANTAAGTVFYNLADGTLNIDAGWSATPSIGDAYEITYLAAIDGAHDSTWAHIEIAKTIGDYIDAGNLIAA